MSQNFRLLVKDIAQDKSIVLFCGAGINCATGVNLSWTDVIEKPFRMALNYIARERGFNDSEKKLLHDIFSSNINECNLDGHILSLRNRALNDFPYEIRSAIMKTVHSKQYIPLLQGYIYSSCNKDKIRDAFMGHYARKNKYKMSHPIIGYEPPKKNSKYPSFHSLYILSKFIMLYDKLEAIVTYNYDNFLTEAISLLADHPDLFFYEPEYKKLIARWGQSCSDKLKIKVIDIYGTTYDQTIKKNNIVVFHVHGFIPPYESSYRCDSSTIVFSQDEYCDTVTNLQTWQNATQMHDLCHHTCIFAGSSMTDLTVKRMINFAKDNGNEENIYNLDIDNQIPKDLKGKEYKYALGRRLLATLKRDYLSDIGVKSVCYPGDYVDLYEEFGKVLYLKSDGRLRGQHNDNH